MVVLWLFKTMITAVRPKHVDFLSYLYDHICVWSSFSMQFRSRMRRGAATTHLSCRRRVLFWDSFFLRPHTCSLWLIPFTHVYLRCRRDRQKKIHRISLQGYRPWVIALCGWCEYIHKRLDAKSYLSLFCSKFCNKIELDVQPRAGTAACWDKLNCCIERHGTARPYRNIAKQSSISHGVKTNNKDICGCCISVRAYMIEFLNAPCNLSSFLGYIYEQHKGVKLRQMPVQ